MNQGGFDTSAATSAETRSPFSLRSYLRILWRWKFLFLPILVVVPVGVYIIVSREHKVYSSTALLNVPSPANAQQVTTLATTQAVASRAARQLRPQVILGTASAATDPSGLIALTVNAPTPQRAADEANAFAYVLTRQGTATLTATIQAATNRLNALPPGDPGRQRLLSEIDQDTTLRLVRGDGAQLIQPAAVNTTPVSPHVARTVTLGVVVGLLLALAAVAVAAAGDRRLHDAEDLEPLTGLPLLGVIPVRAFSGKQPTAPEDEAFATLNASLTYFNVDRPWSTVVVASAKKGEGKTTVASHLALAAARAGEDVVLVDADLRHPQLAARLGLADGWGLESVLTGRVRLEDALLEDPRELRVSDGRIRVLPSFEAPPNPGQLLGSRQMGQLLAELSNMVDRVIIDTTPSLMVADNLPLFKQAPGVLLVTRLDEVEKPVIQRLLWTINNAGGTVIGVVATGAKVPASQYGAYAYAPAVPVAQDRVPSVNGAPRVRRKRVRAADRPE
jgi:tyrosine-protein kinase